MFQIRKIKRILFFYAYFFILLSILFLTGKVQEQAAANTVTRQQERAMKFRTNPYRSHLLRNRRLVKTIERELKSAPVPSSFFSEITYEDSFGADRKENGDYNKNVSRIHEGLDIMYTKNKSGIVPVLSMTDGTIEQMGWLTLGGYRIGVRSKHDIYYYYAHLDRYQEGRHVGPQRSQGGISQAVLQEQAQASCQDSPDGHPAQGVRQRGFFVAGFMDPGSPDGIPDGPDPSFPRKQGHPDRCLPLLAQASRQASRLDRRSESSCGPDCQANFCAAVPLIFSYSSCLR